MASDIPHDRSSDEIDLRELFISLWQARVLILGVTLLITCIAAAYAFLSAPIYETSIRLLPPRASDLASYNSASQLTGEAVSGIVDPGSSKPAPAGIRELTTKAAYDAFLQNLDSNRIKLEFFEKIYLPALGENQNETEKQSLWRRLNRELTVSLPKKPNDVVTMLTLEGHDANTIADWANRYVTLTAKTTQKDFLEDLSSEVEVRSKGISVQIATLRKVGQSQRASRITLLEGALAVAKSIGLATPPSNLLTDISNTSANSLNSASESSTMYLRGSNALQAELELLKSRKNDDAYIPELSNLLKKQNLLASIDLNPTHLAVVDIDSVATPPQTPIKPKKALILALGVVLGGILGIMIALVRKMLRN